MKLDDLQMHIAALRSAAWPEVPPPPDDRNHVLHLCSQANRSLGRAEQLIAASWDTEHDQMENVGFRKGVGMELAGAVAYAFMLADHLKLNMRDMLQYRLNHEWTTLTGSSRRSHNFHAKGGQS